MINLILSFLNSAAFKKFLNVLSSVLKGKTGKVFLNILFLFLFFAVFFYMIGLYYTMIEISDWINQTKRAIVCVDDKGKIVTEIVTNDRGKDIGD